MDTYNARRPSKRLTTQVTQYVENEQQRRETAKTAKELDGSKQDLTEKILELVDQGYAPTPGSDYGVAVLEQSSRVAYERLYRGLIKAMSERFPQYANKISEISANLERQAIEELETKRVVVCGVNSELENLVKRAEKAQLEDRKTSKEVKLVIYT